MPIRARMTSAHSRVARAFALDAHPWHHWLVVYVVLLSFFSAYRGVALATMLRIFATRKEATPALKTGAMVLGFLEDVALVTMLLVLLSACDFVLGPRRSPAPLETEAAAVPPPQEAAEKPDEPIVSPRVRRQVLLQGRRVLRLLVHSVLTALTLVPFAIDNVFLRTRGMRFTFSFITTYFRERDYAKGVEISKYEVRVSALTVIITLAAAAVVVAINMLWLDLSRWHLAMLVTRRGRTASAKTSDDETACSSVPEGNSGLSKDKDNMVVASPEADYRTLEDGLQQQQEVAPPVAKKRTWKRVALVIAAPVVLVALLCSALLVITHNVAPVLSATAMNVSLNELFRLTFNTQFIKGLGDGKIASAADYIHTETESYELFKNDVLFRKTTGFKGPLAFDVQVNASDPPNVLVLVVESFRFQDSMYLVGNDSAALRNKQHNVSLTPQFDRWAKRGIALRNLWSSWQTSRSVESILFGQVPYDDVMDSGTTTGRTHVELHGMPQLFKQKGYETTFTSGVRIKYDQWNKFMPAHGFEYVQGSTAFKAYGEKDYGIKSSDWKPPARGGQGRASFWGVHDDVTFDVLGDMLVNKTAEQRARQRLQQPKKPFFINHYTISSHTPFLETPTWFAGEELPDFSALAEDHPSHAKEIAHYAKLRYFEDLALGKFLDRMQQEGVLNNTIVVITGDHGQSPERGLDGRPDADEIATTRVAGALIAEGRLGDAVGMVFDDAAEHYDLLNTLADIVGVPEGGFLQSGVGRSLKRKIPFGERAVFTNNPMRQMAVVKGHERLSFDRQFNMMALYNPENDPEETKDLLPSRSDEERRQWEALREKDRKLSRYFRVRWDKKCISKVSC